MTKTIFLSTILAPRLGRRLSVNRHRSASHEQKKVAFLDRLKVGQAVALTDKDGRYEIGVLPPEMHPLDHTVVEIAEDYVVLRDIGKITDTVIPIYSIKSIRVLRVPGK